MTGPASDRTSPLKPKSSRANMTAVPWSPTAATDDRDIAVFDIVYRGFHAGQSHSDAGRCQVQTTALTPSQHLGVPGFDLYAGLSRRVRKTDDDAIEHFDFKTFLDERIERQVQGLRASHSQIICRTVNSQTANVAAGKLQWLNGKAVRRDHDLFAVECYGRCIG